MTVGKNGLFDKLVPVLLLASVGLAFAVGVLWQKVSSLEATGTTQKALATTSITPTVKGPTQGKLTDEQAKKLPPVTAEDHVRGSRNAQVFLVEYSDLECPFCKRFHETAKQVVEDYDGKVSWVYRHYPIAQLHSKAPKQSEATECAFELAGEDGFWKLTDKIYEITPANNGLNMDELPKLAASLGINESRFKSCLDSGKYADKVAKQMQGGTQAGVSGTPGNFVINQKGDVWLIPGAVPLESVKVIIDEALK